MHRALLVVAAFLASAVEMVEALTIVLAVGMTPAGDPPLGVAAATEGLIVIVAALGPALAHLPIDSLRLVVGTVLLVFGLQWLRKAILRASGLKALHDEDAIFAAESRRAPRRRRAAETRLVCVHGCVQGGLPRGARSAFIIVTFGGTQHDVGLAAIRAAAAFIIVLVAGVMVHAPLDASSREHPELGSASC